MNTRRRSLFIHTVILLPPWEDPQPCLSPVPYWNSVSPRKKPARRGCLPLQSPPAVEKPSLLWPLPWLTPKAKACAGWFMSSPTPLSLNRPPKLFGTFWERKTCWSTTLRWKRSLRRKPAQNGTGLVKPGTSLSSSPQRCNFLNLCSPAAPPSVENSTIWPRVSSSSTRHRCCL